MKVVLQRVKKAEVTVDGQTVGDIGSGYVLLVGFERDDNERLLLPMAEKILNLKLFPDASGRFAYSVREIEGEILIVSQFTLAAELKKGKKPSFSKSMDPQLAESYYDEFIEIMKKQTLIVQSGIFGAMMQVTLQNDGPVTILLDSAIIFPSLHR